MFTDPVIVLCAELYCSHHITVSNTILCSAQYLILSHVYLLQSHYAMFVKHLSYLSFSFKFFYQILCDLPSCYLVCWCIWGVCQHLTKIDQLDLHFMFHGVRFSFFLLRVPDVCHTINVSLTQVHCYTMLHLT